MKSLIILLFILFNIQFLYCQKVLKNFSDDVCNCIKNEIQQNTERDPKTLIDFCFKKLLKNYETDIRKEFGDDIFNNNSDKVTKFGIEVGKILVQNCQEFLKLSINNARNNKNTAIEYFNLAEQKYSENKNEEAIINYTKAIQLDSRNEQFYNSRGVVHFSMGNYYLAIHDFMTALDIDPDFAIAYLNIANSKKELGDYSNGLADINNSILLNSSNCEAYNTKGLLWNGLDQQDSAYTSYVKAYNCDTTNANYAYNIGFALFRLKEYKNALIWFQKSLLLNKNDVTVYTDIGNTYDILENYTKAIEFHTKSIQFDSSNYIPYYNRGISEYKKGDFQEALSDFNKAFSLDTSDIDVIYYLAKSNEKLNNYDITEQFYNKLIVLSPATPEYYDNRAAFYTELKKYDLAVRDYTFSVTLYPNDCKIYYLLGKVFKEMGKVNSAEENFLKSKTLGCDENGNPENIEE